MKGEIKMDFIPITSSNIKEVAYNKREKELQICFVNGSLYVYYEVPESVFENLLNAESAGKFFYNTIKNKYACERIK